MSLLKMLFTPIERREERHLYASINPFLAKLIFSIVFGIVVFVFLAFIFAPIFESAKEEGTIWWYLFGNG
ncbi:MAG: hypothetical protein GX800_12180 [Clostridiaceae bacterium]|jgi:hypothetical protein|nr:hypothetical protein [Clostridiaceae bacterium]